jgi:phosphoribosyl 1,2-cyclic phosphodiesterase
MGFFTRFWGTRGSIPTPGKATYRYGGNTSCVEIRVNDSLFICDGGTGLRELGNDLMSRGTAPITAHMFFSHMHWDHIQGFPFFVPAYVPSNKLFIYGTRDGDKRFHRLLSGQMSSSYFPVDFAALGGHIEPADLGVHGSREIEGVTVTCARVHHPGGSYAYSFEHEGRKLVYATDNELDQMLFDKEQPVRDPASMRRLPADLIEFCRGADLLIADGQYTDAQYVQKVGWGHARCTTVVDLAVQANVKELAIYHHDPMHSDDEVDTLITTCRQRAESFESSVFIFAAREGLEIRIDRDG